VVFLNSSNIAARVPDSVVVAQGQSSVNFGLTGFAVVRNQRSVNAVITATLGGDTRSVTMTVLQRP
jgi:hypothetical protein